MRTNRSASLLWSQTEVWASVDGSHVESGSVEEHESVGGGELFSFVEELYDIVHIVHCGCRGPWW